MKINEVINESFDNDPENDRVPHLVMQFRKSMDMDGNTPIIFKNGDKTQIPLKIMNAFVNRYEQLKPGDREEMQTLASKSLDDFIHVFKSFSRPAAPKSIY